MPSVTNIVNKSLGVANDVVSDAFNMLDTGASKVSSIAKRTLKLHGGRRRRRHRHRRTCKRRKHRR